MKIKFVKTGQREAMASIRIRLTKLIEFDPSIIDHGIINAQLNKCPICILGDIPK